jgi:hypothetical protein
MPIGGLNRRDGQAATIRQPSACVEKTDSLRALREGSRGVLTEVSDANTSSGRSADLHPSFVRSRRAVTVAASALEMPH